MGASSVPSRSNRGGPPPGDSCRGRRRDGKSSGEAVRKEPGRLCREERPAFWSAISPGRRPAISCFLPSSRLKRVGISEFKVGLCSGHSPQDDCGGGEVASAGLLPPAPHAARPRQVRIFGRDQAGDAGGDPGDGRLLDLVVATGNIEYHYYAGYSGGAKSVLPGVSSERSIIKNHELMRDPRSVSGRLDSPVRVTWRTLRNGRPGFHLECVLNSRKEIVSRLQETSSQRTGLGRR